MTEPKREFPYEMYTFQHYITGEKVVEIFNGFIRNKGKMVEQMEEARGVNVECETSDLTAEVESFLKVNAIPNEVFTVPTDPEEQLRNALAFAETVPHGKGAFLTSGGGYCMRGFLLGGNGIVMDAGTNFGYPFSGKVNDFFGNEVDLKVFRKADAILDGFVPKNMFSGVMDVNDSMPWFGKEQALGLLEAAVDKAAEMQAAQGE